ANDGVTCVACGPGYPGNGTTCADVDECAIGTDTCGGGSCMNTDGGYTCAEPSGGCNTGGGTGAATLLAMAALWPKRRRRPATA
ncbi:MAG TPA: MYXO-CTERM sorting domain-containing protein, partial [Kofleriaceae bacterium]|nr:MYXO-CTERM sorting domain-containing protein [Kofleriaceae bacterium]